MVISASLNPLRAEDDPLSFGSLRMDNCTSYTINLSGNFIEYRDNIDHADSIDRSSRINILAEGLGYKSLQTPFFDLVAGDSIHFDFFLQDDIQRLDNCSQHRTIEPIKMYKPERINEH